MKPLNQLLVIALAGISLATVSAAVAGDQMLTPRAQANQITRTQGTTPDLLDRSVKGGSPKGREMAAAVRKTSGTTPDLINRSYSSIPKLREQSGAPANSFQVAPLK